MTNNNLLQTAIELYKKCPEYEEDRASEILGWTLEYLDTGFTGWTNYELQVDNISMSEKFSESKTGQAILTALIADLERHLGMNIYPLFSITERNDDTGIEHSSQHLFRVGEIYHSHTGNAYKLVELGKGESE
jgi:hypothetical protein